MTEGTSEQGRRIWEISPRAAARIAWSLSVTLTVLSLVLLGLIRSHPNVHIFDWWLGNSTVVIDVTVGAIVASRRWPNSLPAGEALAWIASWGLPIRVGVQVFFHMLFPTGRLPSRRWRPLVWLTGVFILVG